MHEGGYWAYYRRYNNPYATGLIEEAIVSTDHERRQEIYDELAQIYYDDCPGILLVQPTGNRYFQDWVKGFYFNPANPANYGWVYDMSKEY
jgi:ABC-type transport system substrate-binding protein